VYVSLVHYQHVLQTVEVHPGEDEATFTLSNEDLLADMSTIRFRIVDEQTGEGIPGAGIQLRGRGVSIHKSGSDGLVSINRNPPGVYSVQAMHQAYERLDVSFEAKAGLTDLGTLRMGEAVKVRVNVVDEQGAPREAAFHLRVLDPVTRRVVDRDNSVMFGGEGKGLVELSHLGRKLYCLQVAPYKHAGFVPGEDPLYVSESVVLDTRGGPIPDIKVVLRPASRLVLRAVDPIPAELSFQIYDDQDFWVEGEPFRGRSPEPVELASGTYRVTLRDRQGNELSSRFVTVGAEPVVLDLSR
jgi:hypothetical protein